MLRQYIRDRHNQKIGVMLADIVDGTVRIGISRCHRKDKFNINLGLKIANGRLEHENHHNSIDENIPSEISIQIDNFNNRVKRYFKTNQGE